MSNPIEVATTPEPKRRVRTAQHIYQRGKAWYYQFTVRGVKYQGTLGAVSKTAAREIAEKKRIAALEGKLVVRPVKAPLLGSYNAEKREFSDAAKKYLDWYKENRKASSHERFVSAMISLCRFFGTKRLSDIDPFSVERYKSVRKSQSYADASVNRELCCLRHLFSMGRRWGWVKESPFSDGSVKLFKENNARDRWLTLEEEAVLFEHCDAKVKVFAMAAVDTGFRAGELQSLRWQDVDFQRGTVTVGSGYTKNADPRTNPMTKRLSEALQAWKKSNTIELNGGLVFGEYRYREPYERARDAAKLGKDVCFHTLRHTYISRLVMAGVDLRTVQELAGHKTIQMTMRYTHLAPEHKRRAVGLLENQIAIGVTAKVTTVAVAANGRIAVSG